MFEVLDEVCTPTKGSKDSAAVDLYAREDIVIEAGETVIIPLGVKLNIKKLENDFGPNNKNSFENFLKSHYLELEPRSSLRVKGLNAGTGIIDIDYPDEIKLVLHNLLTFKSIIKWIFSFGRNKSVFKIQKGEKIAQILLKEHKTFLMGIETEEKRTGGFGSTENK